MATDTVSARPHVPSLFPERPPSLSSHNGSQPTSLFSQPPSHQKVASQTSIERSPDKDSRSSTRHYSPHQSNGDTRPRKRLRSQYPLRSSDPHVEYIFVASFDIDRGPVMDHQFPSPIDPDEGMLAELMMPDQAHLRQQDWTMFFLHKDSRPGEEEIEEREARRQERRELREARSAGSNIGNAAENVFEDTDSDESDVNSSDSQALMYVLNLVNTKQDSTKPRGAEVKAMAICTKHPFLHIYKPLLLLALEEYFKNPELETLEELYHSVNAMDLSLMPRLTPIERQILQDSDAKDMFVEKYEQMINQRVYDEADGKLGDATNSSVQATARHAVPRDTHEFESRVVYNGISIPVKIPTALVPETVGDFSLIKLVQTFGSPHASQPQPFALHPHLTSSGAYTHPIIVLINAVLTQKRVVFLGHNRPSGEVAEAVLATCALASGGVLRGFNRHAFPYTDLSKVDELMKVNGFIAGVNNPTFSNHPGWWDLLCDIPSGRMKISTSIEPAEATEGTAFFHHQFQSGNRDGANSDPMGDVAFMEDINRSIASRHGEAIIRAKFRAYIIKITRVAAAFEETVYGASALSVISPTELEPPGIEPDSRGKRLQRPMSLRTSSKNLKGHGYVWSNEESKMRELAAYAARIEGWRNTRSYHVFIDDLATRYMQSLSPSVTLDLPEMLSLRLLKPQVDLYHLLSKLRHLRLSPSEAAVIYLAIESYCVDYNTILELLELTPMWEAGLFHISLGLWHEEFRVREAVVNLLELVKTHPVGRIFFSRLGGFAHTGFKRCVAEKEARQQSLKEDLRDLMAPMSLHDQPNNS